MFFLAWKNLWQEKARFFISLLGVTVSVSLVLVLQALYMGWSDRLAAYIGSVDTDFWVGQEGSLDMFHSVSLLPKNFEDEIRKVEGVEEVHRFIGRRLVLDVGGEESTTYVVGYNPQTGVAKPFNITEGTNQIQENEIVVDEVFARKNNLRLGDTLKMFDRDFTIRGLATGGNAMVFQYSFIPLSQAEEIFEMENITNYFLVKGGTSEDIEENVLGVQAFSKEKFVDHAQKLIDDNFLPIILIIMVIGFVVGMAVIGLTIYTMVIEKNREYGVLKALGISNRKLYNTIFIQSLLCGIIGYIFGIGLAFMIAAGAEQYDPAFITYFRFFDFAWIFGVTIVMSLVSSYIPLRRLAQIDPMIVFKG